MKKENQSMSTDIEMTDILEWSAEVFKAAMIKMLQQAWKDLNEEMESLSK